MGTNSEIILPMAIKVVLCALALIGAVFAAPSGAKKLSVASGSSAGRRLLYDPKPISISPAFGPMEGNTLVTVTHDSQADWGSAAQIRCSFGGATSVATALSPTTISCRTPRQATGSQAFVLEQLASSWQAVSLSTGATAASFEFFPSMLVSDFKTSSVLRYNADTGAFFDVFVQPRSGGLDGPWGTAFGLDHHFYVASERTNSVLVYDGSTGAFLKKFCTVKGQPRSLVFHYWDLYVVSAYGDKVYRYNGYTGSPRGVYAEGGGLDHPWGLIFDKFTNDTYVTSEYKDHVFRYKQPIWGLYGGYGTPSTNGGIHDAGSYDPTTQAANPQGQGISNGQGEEITHNAQQLKLGVNVWKGRFDKVWTNTRTNYANGLDLTVDSLYVTGPYCGKCIVRFNRTTGEYMHHFEDEYLNYPVDVKEFRDYLYVCSEDQVRKYNRLNGEFIKTHSQTDGLLSSFLLFHTSWNQNLGE